MIRTILILLVDIIKIARDQDLAYLYEQKAQYFFQTIGLTLSESRFWENWLSWLAIPGGKTFFDNDKRGGQTCEVDRVNMFS